MVYIGQDNKEVDEHLPLESLSIGEAEDLRSEYCKGNTTETIPIDYESTLSRKSSYDITALYDTQEIPGHTFNISSQDEYEALYSKSLKYTESFWSEVSKWIDWISPYDTVFEGGFEDKDYTWFNNGKLNACYNCVDRWATKKPNALAIIYEGDEPHNTRRVTFKELKLNVCRIANVLKSYGVKKGDTVTIYMPNIPELCFSVLACARIGAIHSVVFGGFSSASLAERIHDAQSKYVITANGGYRAKKHIKTKEIMDQALTKCPFVTHCFVFKNIDVDVNYVLGRDYSMEDEMLNVRPFCPVEPMDSEDFLFMLYTSGSTGKPKGLAHTTGGYLVYAYATTKYIFDAREGDIFGCMADVGWITGHTYIIYGPLSNGLTTFMFGSLPSYPDPERYWRMVTEHKITQFYTAPTAIRSLMRFSDEHALKYEMPSLRVLGSVGEPINPEAWRWYYTVVGKQRISIVDTYWQTETGGIVIAPLPGVTKTKPGSATLPFFGIEPAILDPVTFEELVGNDISGLLCIKKPWPGMFRTIYGDHKRVTSTYFPTSKGYYLTGDAAYKDQDGYIWISGRVDDTINISGHRICSAEVEHALVQVNIVAEAAVVGIPNELKGQGIFCYVTLKQAVKYDNKDEITSLLRNSIRQSIGPFATPDVICITPSLPKTRSGKIMRRILRKLASKEYELGDISTLANPEIINELIDLVNLELQAKK